MLGRELKIVFSFRASVAPWATGSRYFRLLLKALLLYSCDFHRDEAARMAAEIGNKSFAQFLIAPGNNISLGYGLLSFARHAASARDQMDRHLVMLVCFVTEPPSVIGK